MKKVIGISLILIAALVFELVWMFAPRSPEGMFQAIDRFPIPQQSKLTDENVTRDSPICLRDFPYDCPYVDRSWNLAEPMKYEELEAMVENANPDFYFASAENTLDEQGYCERACEFQARVTTDKKYEVEIIYHSPSDRVAGLNIAVTEVDHA